MILVAGGTGVLGTHLVRNFTASGDTVRVLTRNAQQADRLRDGGVDVVLGDVRVPSVAATAVHGCATVISAIHGFVGPRGDNPASIDRDGNRTLIRAAADAGVDQVILVSVYGAAPTHPMSLHRMKHAAEQSLIDSGLDWTIVRPVPFLETWIDVIGAHLTDQGKCLVLGPGRNPITVVSVRDVAAVIERASRDTTMRRCKVDVVGPENLTFRHIAEQLLATSANAGRIVHLPLSALRVLSIVAKPVAPAFARQAQAAVIMNTTDMTATSYTDPPPLNPTSPGPTTLSQLLDGADHHRVL